MNDPQAFADRQNWLKVIFFLKETDKIQLFLGMLKLRAELSFGVVSSRHVSPNGTRRKRPLVSPLGRLTFVNESGRRTESRGPHIKRKPFYFALQAHQTSRPLLGLAR